MNTYIAKSQTNYGEVIHLINADSLEEASNIADISGAWEGFEIEELNTECDGLICICGGDG